MNKTNKKFKDPGSAITHLIAMIGAVICAFPLIGKAVHTNNSIVVFAMSVFISSMILLYGASTLYHSLDISKKVNLFFRRIDHSMIFVLIAGSYTPVCLLASASLDGAIYDAHSFARGLPFSMATPTPASSIILLSFSPSPKAIV